jgi:hypothetical protein
LDYDSEEGMTDDVVGELGTVIESTPSNVEFREISTWKPFSNNISETNSGQRIHLNYGQTLAILGQYDLNVHVGIISVYGAFIGSKSGIRRIVSPSTELLPIIRCVSSDGADIDVLNVPSAENYETLGRCSALFRDIWNCSCPNCHEVGQHLSFSKVRALLAVKFTAYELPRC